MKIYLLAGGLPGEGAGALPLALTELPSTWRRPLAVALVAVVACVLHGLLFLWYASRPAPRPFSAAAPLPMIDLVLSAPPAPAVTQPQAPAPPTPPKPVRKPDPKPVQKVRPRPVPKQESAAKQAWPQPPVEPETAPPAPPAPPAPSRERAAAPRHDPYTPASANAGYLNNPKPVYPGVARHRHWEGLVLLRVHVTADGQAGEVKVQRSSGHEVLDEAALEAVRKWRFVPARRGEVAQASWVTVPIEFELR